MDKNQLTCLIIEDNAAMRDGVQAVLNTAGYHVLCADSAEAGLDLLGSHSVEIIITDYKLPGMDGIEFLRKMKEKKVQAYVMVMTAFSTVELAIEAMKAGAWDFIPKPFSKDALLLKTERLAALIYEKKTSLQLQNQNEYLSQELSERFRPHKMIGQSEPMQKVYSLIQKVAPEDTTVFIYGESGTGKELVAQAIHNASSRKENPFIRMNCSALAESLLESELFGHEKGAFTGAIKTKKGRFELANGGTLFMDEIGDVPLSIQVKLLRVLQEKTFERVGGEETLKTDVRLVTATHRDLQNLVREGTFREDLYYRLHIFPIELPPLRARKEDIAILAEHFLKRFAQQRGIPKLKYSKEVLEILMAYNWPGNVRELENIMERAIVLAEDFEIKGSDLDFLRNNKKGTDLAIHTLDLEANVSTLEKRLIREALNTAKGNKSKAARFLGIKETTLHYKLNKYQLRDNDETN